MKNIFAAIIAFSFAASASAQTSPANFQHRLNELALLNAFKADTSISKLTLPAPVTPGNYFITPSLTNYQSILSGSNNIVYSNMPVKSYPEQHNTATAKLSSEGLNMPVKKITVLPLSR